MNKSLLLHELLIMVNKDKWTAIYNPGNRFNVNSYDYNSLKNNVILWEEYQHYFKQLKI